MHTNKKVEYSRNEIPKDADISAAFNTYFTSIGSKLACKINSSSFDPLEVGKQLIHVTTELFRCKCS